MSTEVNEIVNVLHRYKASTNTGNAALAASLYKDDAIMAPANFPTNVGKEAILAFYEYAFSLLQLTLEFDINLDQIVVHQDIAFATTTSTGTRLYKESGETVPEINRELWIFEKVEGTWKIARYMFNIPPTTN